MYNTVNKARTINPKIIGKLYALNNNSINFTNPSKYAPFAPAAPTPLYEKNIWYMQIGYTKTPIKALTTCVKIYDFNNIVIEILKLLLLLIIF